MPVPLPGMGEGAGGGRGDIGIPSPARMLPGGAMPGMPGGQDERVAILVAEFPMFAPAMLADILYANGGDLDRTMEILTQLQVREDRLRVCRQDARLHIVGSLD